MLGYDDRIKLRDALLESTVLQNAASVKDEIDEIRFSDIYDKAKDNHTDTNIDKPTVDEPSDIDLFDEEIDYSDFIEFDDKDGDKMFSSSDIDDIIAETDKVMKALTESDEFEDNVEALFEFDENFGNIDEDNVEALFEFDENFGNIDEDSLDGLTESFDGLNESILNDDIDLDGLTESVVLEEAEAYAMLDELSEQIIRDNEDFKDYNENRLTGLYEDDDELLPVDDDLDGEAEDYIDPEDVKLVDQYLNDGDDEFVVPIDDEPSPVYDEEPEVNVGEDEIHEDYEQEYIDDELGECSGINESEDFTESDDLSFLFESDDESNDDDDDDDSDNDDNDDDDDNEDEDEDEGDEDDEDDDEDDEDEDGDEDGDEDSDNDDDDDNEDEDEDEDEGDEDDDEDDEDDEFDISFDEKEEE